MPKPRVVTIVATISTTADDERIRAAILAALEVPLEEHDTKLIPCGWAPDADTISDALDVDCTGARTEVTVLDLNPGLSA